MAKEYDKRELRRRVEANFLGNLDRIDFETELEGSNEHFYVKPVIGITPQGSYSAMYGIFNRDTNILETETRQQSASKEWVLALTATKLGDPLPGLRVRPEAEEE